MRTLAGPTTCENQIISSHIKVILAKCELLGGTEEHLAFTLSAVCSIFQLLREKYSHSLDWTVYHPDELKTDFKF